MIHRGEPIARGRTPADERRAFIEEIDRQRDRALLWYARLALGLALVITAVGVWEMWPTLTAAGVTP